MEALTWRIVRVGLLEPQVRDPELWVYDVDVHDIAGAPREERRPERPLCLGRRGIQRQLELDHRARIRSKPLALGYLGDPPSQVYVTLGDPPTIFVRYEFQLDPRPGQTHLGVVVGLLGGLGDRRHKRRSRCEVAR